MEINDELRKKIEIINLKKWDELTREEEILRNDFEHQIEAESYLDLPDRFKKVKNWFFCLK